MYNYLIQSRAYLKRSFLCVAREHAYFNTVLFSLINYSAQNPMIQRRLRKVQEDSSPRKGALNVKPVFLVVCKVSPKGASSKPASLMHVHIIERALL